MSWTTHDILLQMEMVKMICGRSRISPQFLEQDLVSLIVTERQFL